MIRPVTVGSAFERGLRTYNQLPQAPWWRAVADKLPRAAQRVVTKWDSSLVRADAVKRMHYEFGLSTNERGAEILALIQTKRAIQGASVLDIGCAYGGFLVAALQQGASQAIGVDINQKLLTLAHANLSDYGLDTKCEVRCQDILAVTEPAMHGAFDVIICNDVIEHVADPAVLIRRIVECLRPAGSVAFLEIPNLRSSRYIASDGHFQLFGITALEHDDAEAYYHCFYPGVDYTVGHVLELSAYRAMFEALGCSVELIAYPRAEESVDICEADYEAFAAKLATFAPNHVPAPLLQTLKARAQQFVDDARADLAKHRAGELSRDEVLFRHYDPFWRLVVRRQGKA